MGSLALSIWCLPFAAHASPAAPAAAAVAEEAAAPPDQPPGLNAEQVYEVLVGELAGRRGDMETAAASYYRAAELTQSPRMAELAVRAAISGKDDAAADKASKLWLRLAPEAPAAYQVAALLRIKAGDDKGALAYLAQLVELSGSAAESVYAQAASIVSRAPNEDQRVSLMRALVERFPETADGEQSLAMVAASASRFDVAERAARRAMELKPDWSAPRIFLVRLAITQGDREKARKLLESFVNQYPDDDAVQMLFGQFLVEEQKFAEARDVFDGLLKRQPSHTEALYASGALSMQLDDLAAARERFSTLFEQGQRKNEAAFYLGQIAEQEGDVAAALKWYQRVEGANVEDAQVRLAYLNAKSGDVSRAQEILHQLRARESEDSIKLYLIEAEILDEVGQGEAAMGVYSKALQHYPNDEDLRYARALYAVKRGQISLAEQDFHRILEAEPDHADALNALGYTLADRTGRYDEALKYIEKAYALKPDEPAILDSMGWINYRLGRYETARDFLQRALAKMNDGEIAAHLGEVLWTLDRRAEAWSVWDAAIKAHPDHPYLQSVVGRYRVSKTEVGHPVGLPKSAEGSAE